MIEPCIEPRHYPTPEPPTPLTADPRLHDYDSAEPCVVARREVTIEELAVICEHGHITWAILCGVDDVALCSYADCRRIAWALDGAGVHLFNAYERQHAAQVERIPA
jgi:hypothetical protein